MESSVGWPVGQPVGSVGSVSSVGSVGSVTRGSVWISWSGPFVVEWRAQICTHVSRTGAIFKVRIEQEHVDVACAAWALHEA